MYVFAIWVILIIQGSVPPVFFGLRRDSGCKQDNGGSRGGLQEAAISDARIIMNRHGQCVKIKTDDQYSLGMHDRKKKAE
jgi:hypothetical protein